MISAKSKWSEKLTTREKWLECRKNKALRKAIENEIKENGKAKVLLYCSQGKPNLWLPYEYDCFELDEASQPYLSDKPILDVDTKMNGKVVGYVVITHVYNVYYYQKEDERDTLDNCYYIEKNALDDEEMGTNTYLEEGSCLSQDELYDYYGGKNGYALYVSDCVVFDKPKELSEFGKCELLGCCDYRKCNNCRHHIKLTKAPQNFCYVED